MESFESLDRNELTEIPSMSYIEHYVEGLYEDIKDKILSTKKILYLARFPENMRSLISNGMHYLRLFELILKNLS